MTAPDFTGITELAGDEASREQIDRLHRRYYWAGEYSRGKDVVELACGAGQGLGYFASIAKSVIGSDVSEPVLATAKKHYGSRIDLRCFGAEKIPLPDASADVLVMFEAIYYVPDIDAFIRESRRVLRPGGYLLIATANKDLFDFTPSPHSVAYYGVRELGDLLGKAGFAVKFYGDTPLETVPLWQRMLRPVKRFVTATGLMPKGKRMKGIMKRLVFGAMAPLPAEIGPGTSSAAPRPLPAGVPDLGHKVIFCEARRGP